MILLRLLGIWKALMSWGRKLVAWAIANPIWALVLALAVFGGFSWSGWTKAANQRDAALAGLKTEKQAYAKFRANVALELANQERIQEQNLDRVATERRAIDERIINAQTASIADWSGRFDRLRAERARVQSAPRRDQMPAAAKVAGQPAPADNDPGGPIDLGMTLVRIDRLQETVEAALQGRAIQEWVLANELVETSPQTPSKENE